MKVTLPVMFQDQLVAWGKGIKKPYEPIEIEQDFFLDGPVSAKVAVLDFDSDGQLVPGVEFHPPTQDEPVGHYAGTKESTVVTTSDAFFQVNAFGTVHNVIAMFEEKDVLGRELTWAFDAPQLLVIPRAGQWANAFYNRDSHSLQFFSFPSERKRFKNKEVYTSLSHDIIAHETGHAVLDGVAPDLYNSITPQSLALHEAIADLTALVMAVRFEELCKNILKATDGSIEGTTALSGIAEEFGGHGQPYGPLRPLRSLLHDKAMPAAGGRGLSPHELSEVLSGALFAVYVKMHDARKKKFARQWDKPQNMVALEALQAINKQFKRMAFRALDYLPPGEISFADYGRAIIAADEILYPESDTERKWIAEEFKKRKIISRTKDLLDHAPSATRRHKLDKMLADEDLQVLVDSDWAAYDFANRSRIHLGIPKNQPFRVRPRLIAQKSSWSEDEDIKIRECIFKVSWDDEEKNSGGRGLPPWRQITRGIMLSIDWKTKKVRALLTTDPDPRLKMDRDLMLTHLLEEGRLRVGPKAQGPHEGFKPSVARAEVSGELLRVRRTLHMLHVEGEPIPEGEASHG